MQGIHFTNIRLAGTNTNLFLAVRKVRGITFYDICDTRAVKELYASCWSQEVKSRPTMSYVDKVLAGFKTTDFDVKPSNSRKRPMLKKLR
jgi:hypothetical protein